MDSAAFILVLIFQVGLHRVSSLDKTKLLPTRAGLFEGSVRNLDVFGETKSVERYLGLPFAESPRRFQKSVVKAPLGADSIYNATQFRPACSQLDLPLYGPRKPVETHMETSEDCLYLNIYKPAEEKIDRLRPVIVFIHGGGFIMGATPVFSGDYISTCGDIIFVTITYRLAVFGFLSTGNSTLPGNLGLWDQHTALQWVHGNIEDFGGDPAKVTIIGDSAGGASVVFQSLFPKNKGLFQRAIAMSGSITCPWVFQPNPYQVTLRFAHLLGCPIQFSTREIIQCIESKSTEEIHSTLNDPENGYIRYPMELITVTDGEFLPANPYKVINIDSELSADAKDFFASLDFMTGLVSGEGGIIIHPFAGVWNTFEFSPSRDEFENKLIPEAVKIMFGEHVPDVVKDMIKHKYTNWSNPDATESVRQSFLDMAGDYVFNFHAKLVADMHANLSSSSPKSGNTFAYYVEAFPSQHILEIPEWVSKPNHCDDFAFLLGYDKEGLLQWTTPYSEDYQPEDWELETSKLYMTLFTNFAKTGYYC